MGSRLLGQTFSSARYFHLRPSAAGSGYDAANSSGTNLGPISDKLLNGVADDPSTKDVDESFAGVSQLVEQYRKENGLGPDVLVPGDAVTRSASGLDPHISAENARLQAPRVAKERGLAEARVQELMAENTDGRDNIALDKAAPESGSGTAHDAYRPRRSGRRRMECPLHGPRPRALRSPRRRPPRAPACWYREKPRRTLGGMSGLENEGTGTVGAIPLHRRVVDVYDLLAGAIELLREQAEALGVKLVLKGAHGAARTALDPEKIAWAVTTLVGNALRFVRKGSRRAVGGTIEVRIDVQSGWLRIAVEDDGPGIPEEKLAVLFARAGEVRHGVGLGLLMIRDVVVAHGGDIEVTSRSRAIDPGTCVAVRIPLDAANPTPATAGGASATPMG